jgi:DNA-binding NarL/FixJ family response regulator
VANNATPNAQNPRDALAIEIGRIAKLFGLYMVRDIEDESKKVTRLNAVGFSTAEIALMLDKTEQNVRVQISQSKKKKEK